MLKKIPVKKREKSDYPMVSMDDYRMSYPPSFYLIDKQVPEIEGWEVGKTYKIVVEIEMTGKNEVKDKSADKIGVSGNFDIVGYDAEESDEDLEAIQGKALSKK